MASTSGNFGFSFDVFSSFSNMLPAVATLCLGILRNSLKRLIKDCLIDAYSMGHTKQIEPVNCYSQYNNSNITAGDPLGGFKNGYFMIIETATLVYSSLLGYLLYPNMWEATDDRKDFLASLLIVPLLRSKLHVCSIVGGERKGIRHRLLSCGLHRN